MDDTQRAGQPKRYFLFFILSVDRDLDPEQGPESDPGFETSPNPIERPRLEIEKKLELRSYCIGVNESETVHSRGLQHTTLAAYKENQSNEIMYVGSPMVSVVNIHEYVQNVSRVHLDECEDVTMRMESHWSSAFGLSLL